MSDELREAEAWERQARGPGNWGARLEIKNPTGDLLGTEFYLDGMKLRGLTACAVEWAYADAPIARLTIRVQDLDIDHEVLVQLLATKQGADARAELVDAIATDLHDALKARGIG